MTEHRKFADILEEITGVEQAIRLTSDPGGHQANRLAALKVEALDHPDAAAGKDLPPIVGYIGARG